MSRTTSDVPHLASRVGGRRLPDGEPMTVRSPYDGHAIATVPLSGPDRVAAAVTAAARGDDPLPAWRRAEILDTAADLLAEPERVEDFARRISAESAKPIRTARGEVARAASTFRFAAATCRTLGGEVLPLDASAAGEGRLGFTVRHPIGVVGAITPFNFPLNLVVHKLAPAIAAGCRVVLKPAHQTPLTALALVDLLLDEAGLPPSWLHVVTGDGPTTGAALVADPRVALITFTGSPDVGWSLRRAAPRTKVLLELGNNSPVIVEPGADVAGAAAAIVPAAFTFSGQSCISVQRVLVHEDVADELTAALVERTERLVVGDPDDDATDVSSVIDRGARDRVVGTIRASLEAGSRLLTGGEVTEDGVLAPAVVSDVDPSSSLARDELFGPALGLSTYRDLDEAIAAANDTRYGLQAGIFTPDLGVAMRASRELAFGGVIVNDVPTWRADQMPYGGGGDSGNTREGPRYTVEEMTEMRTVVIADTGAHRTVRPTEVAR